MIKYTFSDGFIEIRDGEKGSTIAGTVAHEVYFLAAKIAREESREFNQTLKDVCEIMLSMQKV